MYSTSIAAHVILDEIRPGRLDLDGRFDSNINLYFWHIHGIRSWLTILKIRRHQILLHNFFLRIYRRNERIALSLTFTPLHLYIYHGNWFFTVAFTLSTVYATDYR